MPKISHIQIALLCWFFIEKVIVEYFHKIYLCLLQDTITLMRKHISNIYNSLVYSLTLVALSVGLSSCGQDEAKVDLDQRLKELLELSAPDGRLDYFVLPSEFDYPAIPQDARNPITKAKVDLGRALFHETGLAVDAKKPENMLSYSCASCHHVAAGFQAGVFQGIGEGGVGFGRIGEGRVADIETTDHDVQPIKSPSAMNVAYQEVMLWNGQFGAKGINEGTEFSWTPGTPKENNHFGYEGVETQAIAGLGVHRLNPDIDLSKTGNYKNLFAAAFPEIPESNRYTKEYAALAIAAYERTLLSNRAPFQKWLRGNKYAMTEEEKQGAILFFDKAACVECHTGPALNSLAFYGLGMNDLFQCPEPTLKTAVTNVENLGRGGFTKKDEDLYKFKVPQLYNLKDSPFYGHGSSFRTIEEVLRYKNNAIKQNPEVDEKYISVEFAPIGLTDVEIKQLDAFLSEALYDPDLTRYVPLSLQSGLCFPNNDQASKVDLNCD